MEKRYSSKLNVQLLTETLIECGIKHVIISPGSRNGPLTMQFVNHPKIQAYSIVDERCAAFVALGMAQKLQKPVAICCTSGSALANYYPAVTEAFYHNIPIILLTADRPTNYVDIFDGQTIRQENFFEKHSYFNGQLKDEEGDEALTENFLLIKQAITKSYQQSGPVHINIPLSEPLYNFTEELLINFDKITIPHKQAGEVDWKNLESKWQKAEKIMVLVGMQPPNKNFQQELEQLSQNENVAILCETTSNTHNLHYVGKIDATLSTITEEELEYFQPDLLITLGQNVVSKRIKQFLRKYKPKEHWHVNSFWWPDTYFCLTEKIEIPEILFLKEWNKRLKTNVNGEFKEKWLAKQSEKERLHNRYISEIPFCDLYVFNEIVSTYPKDSTIQYSNSSIIRYSQLFNHTKDNPIFCNRGTSGIDGSTSTAVGFALPSNEPVILVTGDISFFYDSNGLWNNYIPRNFRIILLNNGGGNIFKIIPGPNKTNALEQYFETEHHLTAEHLATMFGFDYAKVNDKPSLKNELESFYLPSSKPKILEIQTAHCDNAQILKEYFKF